MQRLLHILAMSCSILLHPLLMPTYGMALMLASLRMVYVNMDMVYILVAMLGTIFFTLLIPGSIIYYLWKSNKIDSLNIDEAKQRTAPYVYTIMAYGFWVYFIYDILHLPMLMLSIGVGAILALTAVTIINHWWKISAHLTGIGGLLGGLCSYALFSINTPIALIIIILILALMLMYARLYLNAHTPLQVVAGLLLGLLTVFIPNLIICYA